MSTTSNMELGVFCRFISAATWVGIPIKVLATA
jgi:hypothetical protein